MELAIQELRNLMVRDLGRLQGELEQFSNEENIWRTLDGVTNSAGNLSLHLEGNLKHFIGAVLGKDGYQRDRPREFSAKGIKAKELINGADEASKKIEEVLGQIDNQTLSQEYPIQVFGYPMTTMQFLLHLSGHLNYHLGQINYIRRLLEPKGKTDNGQG